MLDTEDSPWSAAGRSLAIHGISRLKLQTILVCCTRTCRGLALSVGWEITFTHSIYSLLRKSGRARLRRLFRMRQCCFFVTKDTQRHSAFTGLTTSRLTGVLE